MMARLIDATAVVESLTNFTPNGWGKDVPYIRSEWAAAVKIKDNFMKAITEAPTIDAVEVVRCKDCKHYKPQKKSAHWENRANYCNRVVTIKTQPYDFCSYGERKDGDDE